MRSWPGLVEVFVILLFALGWGVVGLARSLDKKPDIARSGDDAGSPPRHC